MLHCSKIYLLCLNLCSILTHYAQIMPNYLCLSSHALLIISNLWIKNKWLKHKITCQNGISQKRSIHSKRTVSYVIVLLELLTVLLEYIDLSVIAILISKNSYYYTNILPIMLALCSMLSDTYYAHNYASIIGGSLVLTRYFLITDYSFIIEHFPGRNHVQDLQFFKQDSCITCSLATDFSQGCQVS